MPPQSDFTLVLEGPVYHPVELNLVPSEGSSSLRRSLELEDVTTPLQIELRNGAWQETPSPDPDSTFTGLRFWWVGATEGGVTEEQIRDAELTEQLRALGYIQ